MLSQNLKKQILKKMTLTEKSQKFYHFLLFDSRKMVDDLMDLYFMGLETSKLQWIQESL